MKLHGWLICCAVVIVGSSCFLGAQQGASARTPSIVPQLVNFSGRALDASGKPLAGITGATFSIYAEQSGGAPLWVETQNIQADAKGNYSVQLGATSADGLPLELFASGQARWLGIRVNGGEEQSRVLLLSVPYALKAADAQTLGGLPASAFLLAGASNAAAALNSVAASSQPSSSPATSADVTTSGGTANTLPLFTTATNVQSSILAQTGSGTTGKIGINTTSPATTLDINGPATVRGALALPTTGVATATAGKNSQPVALTASAYNSSTKAAMAQNLRWQAEPAGNNTATPGGTLNLLYSSGTGTAAETGLKIANNGQITFATGQTLPTVTGNETVTGDVSATQLISTVPTGTAPLKVTSTTEVANLNASLLGGVSASAFAKLAGANTFTANQTVNGSLSATGTISGGSFEIGGSLFDYGSAGNQNAFLGFAGNNSMTGGADTAVGVKALSSNTTGQNNTASGDAALASNTAGSQNTATGAEALYFNTGFNNAASGYGALVRNSTGNNNTASGYGSGNTLDLSSGTGSGNTFLGANAAMVTGTLSNATAIGANALVLESNALVLGSLAGANGATANTSVGIGTTGPNVDYQLEVDGRTPFGAVFIQGFNVPSGFDNGGDGLDVYGGDGAGGATDGTGGTFVGGNTTGGAGDGIFAQGGSGDAGYFNGNVEITGNLSEGSGASKIDHPLDPANKYLSHSFVESPDMKNIYDGNVTTDSSGLATITLPDWFEVLNRDFRYQLTVIGQFAQAIVAKKIENNQFQIRTSSPDVEVSWRVTGIRQDPWANAHRIPVEEEKEARLKGFYIHPELYGAPPEKQIEWARHPQTMKRMQEARQHIKENQAQPTSPPTTGQHTRMLPAAATLPHGSMK